VSDLLVRVLKWAIVVAMPAFLVLTATRIMFTGWFPRWEYARPDFPPDPYGFTQEERTDYALASIAFLNSSLPPEQAAPIIGDLRLPGSDHPLFDPNEMSHMIDVKRLTDRLIRVWLLATGIVVVGSIILLARQMTRRQAYLAWRNGGALTTILLGVLVLFALLSWRTFFVAFHDVFFPPGTWTFDWENSLIRIFPDKFWFDAFLLPLGAVLVVSVALWVIGFVLVRHSPAPTTSMQAAAQKG
jgi:integral membrane protein (TIGR01906 family)